jgi:prevent-host-death family protein
MYFNDKEKSVHKIIGVTELQRRFRTVLDEVVGKHIPYILTRGSRPEAVIIPYEDFVRFRELQEQTTLERFDRLLARLAAQNSRYSDEEVAADIEAARTERNS